MSEWIVKSIEHLLDFSNILNASIAASWMVLAVIVLRFLLKKAPRWIHVALWGLVAVRLLLPFSIESSLSLIPSAETIPHELLRVEGVQLQEPAYLDVVSNPIFPNEASVEIGQTIDRVQVQMTVMTLIWLIGVAVLLVYTITSYWHLRHKVREAVILRDNIFRSENAGSPFILGIIKPRIYLPYKIEEQTLVHVIAHEQVHIQRKDHWWKPLGFLLLTIHWFNPLMWLGYVLLCRDIELACDEKVIKDIDNEQRANYSQALVACSVKRPMIAACPLAFGEVGVKERVKSVLNYKKPAFWIIIVAVVACIMVGVYFLTSPKAGKDTITYVQRDTAIGQRADFNVDIGKNVTRAELVAEMWQNGQCTSSSPVIVTSQTEKITLLFSDRRENLNLIGENIQIDTDEKAGSLVTYFAFPERVVGWAFTSWQDAVNVPVKAGEDVILAAMACDMGNGVRSIDCQSLTSEPERLTSADCMIAIRAKFYGSVVNSDKVTLSELLSPDYHHDGVWTYLSEDYSVSSSFVVNDDRSITGVVSKDGETTDFSILYRMVKGNDNRAVCEFYDCSPEIAHQAERESYFMFEAQMKVKDKQIQFEFDEDGTACFGKKKVPFALAITDSNGAILCSHSYSVVEVTYEASGYDYSMVAQLNTPVYTITEDMQLLSKGEYSSDEWTALGTLAEIDLSKKNFDELFSGSGKWYAKNETATYFRENTANAWAVIYQQDILYYVLQQKNGDILLAYGYNDYSEKSDPHSDDTNIRWLYRLAYDIHEDTGIVAVSGENVVPVVIFPIGTSVSEVKDSIFWLDIAPEPDDSVPFAVYCDGHEQYGQYGIHDAETMESIKFFEPSGLSPQTYLFQNAEYGHDYIVTLRVNDADLLCFGARIGNTAKTDTNGLTFSVTGAGMDDIEFLLTNGTDYLVEIGDYNRVQRLDGSQWTTAIDHSIDPFPADSKIINPGESLYGMAAWVREKITLDPGYYRYLFEVFVRDSDTGEKDSVILEAEFDIK